MSEDLKALLDDSQETELMEFIEEYNKSEDKKYQWLQQICVQKYKVFDYFVPRN